ncbi:MAG: ABC transporter ATP-binding protein [Bacilli bacterium]|nr:ABC transporter ATP-binding protein [Bacilli bacterium]
MGKSNNKNKSNQKEKDTKGKVIKTEKKEIDKDKVILSIQNASYRYSDAAEDEYALRDISYDFEKGKIYAIKGRSGTGKTTLLSLISGLERCTEGTILFDGKNLKDINLDTYRNSQIGIVFQSYNLLPYMTASENIILSMDASGQKIENKKQKAKELMESVGLKSSYADRKVLRLSGGEQQRVAIARSLSYNPKMIVADEPTGNLDKQTESEILDIFKKLAHEEGKCVIIVTHSPNVCDVVDEIYDLKKVK